MPMFQITASVAGEELYTERRVGLENKIADLRVPFRRIGIDFRRMLATYYATSASTAPWAALSAKYARWKRRQPGGNGPILTGPQVRDKSGNVVRPGGELKRSMTFEGATGNVTRIDQQEAEFGSDLRTPDGKWGLALTHQFGSTKRNLPARPQIAFDESAYSRWQEYIRQWLVSR